jgi:hypothetical protein
MKIDIVDGDTWHGLYLNDNLAMQDHSISLVDALKLLEDEVVEFSGRWFCSLDWLDKAGTMPRKLEDVMILHNGKDVPIFEYSDAISRG